MLSYFKYANFFVENIDALLGVAGRKYNRNRLLLKTITFGLFDAQM
jgi:hypothetical protein